jgi:endogenous inhibitor of DNA gyrase (YacG/DUF329 family)
MAMSESKRALLCPLCGKPTADATRPFCSKRCADIDLGRWFTGQYRIPASEDVADEEAPEPA